MSLDVHIGAGATIRLHNRAWLEDGCVRVEDEVLQGTRGIEDGIITESLTRVAACHEVSQSRRPPK